MTSSMIGTTEMIGPWPLALSSTVAAGGDPVEPLRQGGGRSRRSKASASSTIVLGWVVVEDGRPRTVIVGRRSRRQTIGCSRS